MQVPPPPQYVLDEMRQQLELATTKCGSLLQQLDLVKDRVRKSSSTNLVEMAEYDEDSPPRSKDVEDEGYEDQSISGDVYQDLSADLNQEIKEIFGGSNKGQEVEKTFDKRPLSASSASSDPRSIKSRQDIIDIFIKRLENIENDDETNYSPQGANLETDNLPNEDYNEVENEEIVEYLSSIQLDNPPKEKEVESKNEPKDRIETKVKVSDTNISMKTNQNDAKKKVKAKKPKVQNKLPSKLSAYQTSMLKIAKHKTNTKPKPMKKVSHKNLSTKKNNIVPVNDVVNFMKKIMNKKDNKMPSVNKSSIRSGKRKDDYVKRVPFINYIKKEPVKRSKSTMSSPLVRQTLKNEQRTNKIANVIRQNNIKIAENEKKIMEQIIPAPPKLPANLQRYVDKNKEQEEDITEGKPDKLVTSLMEKLKNSITKQPTEQSDGEEEKPKNKEKTILAVPKLPSQTRSPSTYNQQKAKVPPKVEINKLKNEPKIANKIEVQNKQVLPDKAQSKVKMANVPIKNVRANENRSNTEAKQIRPLQPQKNDVGRKINLFEPKNVVGNDKSVPTKVPNVEGPRNLSKVIPKSGVPKQIINQKDVLKEIVIQKNVPKIESKFADIEHPKTAKRHEFDTQSLHPRTAMSSFPLREATRSHTTLIGTAESFQMPVAIKNKPEKPLQPVRFNSIPFIVGQSTSKSYHIGLNIQQTLSLFKLSPSLTSLTEPNQDKALSEKSSAFTLFVSPTILQDKFRKQQCPACVNHHDTDEEDPDDPWAIPQKDSFDQKSRQSHPCNCLPRKLLSFHEVLGQLFQADNKMFTKYQNCFVNSIPAQNEEDVEKLKDMVTESQKSFLPYRQNNTLYYTKLLRNIQKLQDTFVR